MEKSKLNVFFIIGTDAAAINAFTSSLCNDSAYFYKSAPGKAVVHANNYTKLNHVSDGVSNLNYILNREEGLDYPAFSIYLENHCKEDECLVLGDIAHTSCIYQWIENCRNLQINARVLYIHRYSEHTPHENLSLLSIFENTTRNVSRYAIDIDNDETYSQEVIDLISNRFSINAHFCKKAITNVHAVQPINQVTPPVDLKYLTNLLIHNCNSEWTHDIELLGIRDILNYSLSIANDYSEYEPHCLAEIHHRDEDGDHVTEVIIPLGSVIQSELNIDLSTYEEIHLLAIKPINSLGLFSVHNISLVTKSNKLVEPSYQVMGDMVGSNTYISQNENAKIKLNIGTYAFALKYLRCNLSIYNTAQELISLYKRFGQNSLYPSNHQIKLKPTNQFTSSIKYALDQLVLFQGCFLLVKGWAVSEHNHFKICTSIPGVDTIDIPLTYCREDISKLFNQDGNKLNAFWKVVHLKNPISEQLSQALFILKSDNENLTFRKSIRHVQRPSALTLDNQYAIQLNQWKSKGNPNKIDSTISDKHKISIVTPVYNVDAKWLDLCIESVLRQTYANWQLCLFDDCSTKKETIDCLRKWEAYGDERILIGYGQENANISAATNGAIALADGDFVTFLDNDDELTSDALFVVSQYLAQYPDTTLLYSDEDKLEMTGHRTGPYFKSDFNIDLLRSNNYFTHLTVVRKDIGDKIGWLRLGYEGAQDHDFVLRAVDAVDDKTIKHIPEILYHWRKIPTSTAGNYGAKDYAQQAGVRALHDHMVRNGIQGEVRKGNWGGAYRMVREIINPEKVSIIIPFRDQVHFLKDLIPSILSSTIYEDYEIILVNNQSEEKETLTYLEEINSTLDHIKILDYNFPFNYATMNNWAVDQAQGKYILLLNNDMKVITPGWLTSMVEHIQRPEVGIVGCKLLYADNTLQHAGVLMGINGSAGHAFKGMPNGTHYFNMGVIKNVSGVTGACLLTKKSLYQSLKGLDEENFKIAYNDVDYCLRVRQAGHLIVYTPYAELYHYESKSRGYEDTPEKEARHLKEKSALQKKWGDHCKVDPYYNPNLSYMSQANALAIELQKVNINKS